MVLREEMYFEPRIINSGGSIRWFGETYIAQEMLQHTGRTVYVRDSGSFLYVYKMNVDNFYAEKIDAVFVLVCKIEKHTKESRYGRKIT